MSVRYDAYAHLLLGGQAGLAGLVPLDPDVSLCGAVARGQRCVRPARHLTLRDLVATGQPLTGTNDPWHLGFRVDPADPAPAGFRW